MTTATRGSKLAVGAQVRRWRLARGHTLAALSRRSGLNVGSRDIRIVEVVAPPGGTVGLHAHPGDEHHIVLSGRFRARQGETTVELGPGDYLRWDGAVPHEGAIVGDEPAHILILRIEPAGDARTGSRATGAGGRTIDP